MVRIAIVRRELSPTYNVLLRFAISAIGVAIAIVSLSILLDVDILFVGNKIIETFIRPDILRYVIVFLPIGLGLSIAFHSKLWNLGAEGQMVLGAIGATYIAVLTPLGKIPIIGPITTLLFAIFIGILWALIPAFLRIYLGVNEALVTLLLNHVAYYLADYLVYGPWKGRTVYGFPETDPIPSSCRFPWIYGYSFSLYSLIIAIIVVPITYLFLYKTRIGISIRALGSSKSAVELSGISSRRVTLLAFAFSGAIAGLVGGNEVLMYHRKLVPGQKIGGGMGFISILVAWFADLNPLAIPLSAYYVSTLYHLKTVIQMGEFMEPIAGFFTGLVFVLLLISMFITRYRMVIR